VLFPGCVLIFSAGYLLNPLRAFVWVLLFSEGGPLSSFKCADGIYLFRRSVSGYLSTLFHVVPLCSSKWCPFFFFRPFLRTYRVSSFASWRTIRCFSRRSTQTRFAYFRQAPPLGSFLQPGGESFSCLFFFFFFVGFLFRGLFLCLFLRCGFVPPPYVHFPLGRSALSGFLFRSLPPPGLSCLTFPYVLPRFMFVFRSPICFPPQPGNLSLNIFP